MEGRPNEIDAVEVAVDEGCPVEARTGQDGLVELRVAECSPAEVRARKVALFKDGAFEGRVTKIEAFGKGFVDGGVGQIHLAEVEAVSCFDLCAAAPGAVIPMRGPEDDGSRVSLPPGIPNPGPLHHDPRGIVWSRGCLTAARWSRCHGSRTLWVRVSLTTSVVSLKVNMIASLGPRH